MLELFLLTNQPNIAMSCQAWKETVEVVEESTILSDREKDGIIKDMRIPSRCIKSTST
jgi:hypothetical protein